MSGRTRGTVAFLAITVILVLFDTTLIAVTALGCCGVTSPGDAWAAIAFLWTAAIPLTCLYAYHLCPRSASY